MFRGLQVNLCLQILQILIGHVDGISINVDESWFNVDELWLDMDKLQYGVDERRRKEALEG